MPESGGKQIRRQGGTHCVPKSETSGHPLQPGPGGGERGLEDTGEQVLDYDYEDTTYSPRILGLLFTLFRPRKSLTFHVFCRPPPPSFQSEGLVKGLFYQYPNICLFECHSPSMTTLTDFDALTIIMKILLYHAYTDLFLDISQTRCSPECPSPYMTTLITMESQALSLGQGELSSELFDFANWDESCL